MATDKFLYKCTDCGRKYSAEGVKYLCPICAETNTADKPPKGILKVLYNYGKISSNFDTIKNNKFSDLLPLKNLDNLPVLKVGNTPLYKYDKFDEKDLNFNVFLKDDSQNPTFSFKDRASCIVSAYAKENGIDTIIAASTGNAGSSLAGICASQNQKAVIIVPETAPLAKLTQIVMYGAKIIPVKGTYDDAFDLSIKATEKFGWYNRNTAFNPLTIEGKKTVSFELYEQLNQTLPEKIFVPVGDGVIISGVYKGFEDLLMLGIIERMPVIVAVQSEGSKNLIHNLNSEDFEVFSSNTIADSVSVDIPRNFYMVKEFIKKYKGEYLTVSDKEIIEASIKLSRNTGLFAEPAATTAFAGMLAQQKNGTIPDKSNVVVLLTGSGLKDLKSVQSVISIPEAIEPVVESLENFILIK